MVKINEKLIPNEVYSTNEVKTNKIWIDGKPIYRKVIDNVSITTGVGNSVASGITNMDILVKLEGNLKYTGNNQWITIPSYYSSSIFITANYDYTQNKIFWDCGFFTGTGYFVVEYTKTTD